MRRADIAIIGAGFAGSTAAAMLARAGRDVLIVDPHPRCNRDLRVEKLAPSQIAILRKTGLAESVLPTLTPARRQSVVRLGRFVHKRTDEQYGFYYNGLVNTLRDLVPADRFVLEKVAGIRTSADRQLLTFSNGEEISVRLVVLATGPNHALRESLGIQRNVLSACHSISIGYDIKPAPGRDFDFDGLTCFPENPHRTDPVSYLTLFRVGDVMRANLFVYRELEDPWLRAFRDAPKETALAACGACPISSALTKLSGKPNSAPSNSRKHRTHPAGCRPCRRRFRYLVPAAGTGSTRCSRTSSAFATTTFPAGWQAVAWTARRSPCSTPIPSSGHGMPYRGHGRWTCARSRPTRACAGACSVWSGTQKAIAAASLKTPSAQPRSIQSSHCRGKAHSAVAGRSRCTSGSLRRRNKLPRFLDPVCSPVYPV
jgi:hypothetical protein